MSEQVPQIPSRQSESKAIGSSPRAISPSLTTSNISRKDISGTTLGALYSLNSPGLLASFCRQTRRVKFILFVTPLRHFHFFVNQWLLVQSRRLVRSLVFPGRYEGKV